MNAKTTPRLRMFAGPNGSGKSTVKNKINSKLLGVYLNADDIEQDIKKTGQFDLTHYHATAQNALTYLCQSARLQSMTEDLQQILISHQTLIFKNININSYIASALVDFLRYHLLKKGISFTFETVMSHTSKIEFLQQAQQQGFRRYLYFVATTDPQINISRVRYRVKTGGHDVPQNKIIERYHRSLSLLIDAIGYSHRAYIFDNSSENDSDFLAEITNGTELEIKVDTVPLWFKQYVLDKF